MGNFFADAFLVLLFILLIALALFSCFEGIVWLLDKARLLPEKGRLRREQRRADQRKVDEEGEGFKLALFVIVLLLCAAIYIDIDGIKSNFRAGYCEALENRTGDDVLDEMMGVSPANNDEWC